MPGMMMPVRPNPFMTPQMAAAQQMSMTQRMSTAQMSTTTQQTFTQAQVQALLRRDHFRDWERWMLWQAYTSRYGYGMGYGLPLYGGYGAGYDAGYSPPSYSSRYEREYPPEEPARVRTKEDVLVHSLTNPSPGEILSGQALNDILADIGKQLGQASTEAVAATPLGMTDAELAHINVTRGSGNIALLKRDRIAWPAALSGPDDQTVRDQMTALLHDAVDQARHGGRVKPATIEQMAQDVDQLQKSLPRLARNVPVDAYVEAKTFVKSLDAAVTALRQPDAGNWFNGQYALKAGTVPELVRWMMEKGLQFAPALPGDVGAYTSMHHALAAHDRALHGSEKPTEPEKKPASSANPGSYGALNIP